MNRLSCGSLLTANYCHACHAPRGDSDLEGRSMRMRINASCRRLALSVPSWQSEDIPRRCGEAAIFQPFVFSLRTLPSGCGRGWHKSSTTFGTDTACLACMACRGRFVVLFSVQVVISCACTGGLEAPSALVQPATLTVPPPGSAQTALVFKTHMRAAASS